MHEYMSLKVSSGEHADLATQLTTLSTQGWNVVNIVSTGVDLIAYVTRPQPSSAGAPAAGVDVAPTGSEGWAPASKQPAAGDLVAPAKWYPDPSGRYEYRYWDGSKWTDNVSRAGVTYKDPPVP